MIALTPDELALCKQAFDSGFYLVLNCGLAGVSLALVLNFIKR